MRIAYLNAKYVAESTTGGNAHIGQFIANAVALGHEIWSYPGSQHKDVKLLSPKRFERFKTLRSMDALYVRMGWTPSMFVKWSLPPHRQLLGNPKVAWEFNVVPKYGLLIGKSKADVQTAIKAYRHYGKGCDLVVCVSNMLSDYVKEHLGLLNVITSPNGSDPDLFCPNVSPVSRVQRSSEFLNVVWMGSAKIPWHNFDILRQVADILWIKDKDRRINFHIIGDYFRQMEDMPVN